MRKVSEKVAAKDCPVCRAGSVYEILVHGLGLVPGYDHRPEDHDKDEFLNVVLKLEEDVRDLKRQNARLEQALESYRSPSKRQRRPCHVCHRFVSGDLGFHLFTTHSKEELAEALQ